MSNLAKTLASHEKTCRRLLILFLLYLIPSLAAMKPVVDPDIWWHLRTGQWIVENGAVPKTDPFSSYEMAKTWIAYSWLFDVLVYGLFRTFGLTGLVIYTLIMSLLITVALHALVSRLEPRFPVAALITAVGIASMVPMLSPRPWLFTILFFIIELDIILLVCRSGNRGRLLLLPPLFIIWANTHIQFIYGLFVLALATAEPLIYRLLPILSTHTNSEKISLWSLLLITLLCATATIATPYHFYLYRVVVEYMAQTVPFQHIDELLPVRFGSLPEWLVLISTLGAVLSIAWRRELRPFLLLLIVAGIFLSFRVRRDLWFVVVAAAIIIASIGTRESPAERFPMTTLRASLVSAAILITLAGVAWFRNISEGHLEEAVAKIYPVSAAAAVEQHAYPGPLYNHLNWGGYLIWRLPNLPVSMDGRTNLHGDKRIERSVKTWTGAQDWASDPELTAARLVIADVNLALTSLLRLDPRFELVYEDKVAAVFVARAQDEER